MQYYIFFKKNYKITLSMVALQISEITGEPESKYFFITCKLHTCNYYYFYNNIILLYFFLFYIYIFNIKND